MNQVYTTVYVSRETNLYLDTFIGEVNFKLT